MIHRLAVFLASLLVSIAGIAAPAAPENARLQLQRTLPDFTTLPGTRRSAALSFAMARADATPADAAIALESRARSSRADAPELDAKVAGAFQPPMAKSMSRAEAIATSARREGLPLAKLWESKSALVSVGLNQKGHFGLWLIQKSR